MSFTIPNLKESTIISSTTQSINDFTRRYPLASIIGVIALSILAYSALATATFSGLIIGAAFAFTAFTSLNHMITHREDFVSLIKLSFNSLKSNRFDQRQSIDVQAETIRNQIISRDTNTQINA